MSSMKTPQPSLGEFTKQLILLLQQQGMRLPLHKERPWHLLFYELKRGGRVKGRPAFFDSLRFDWDSPYPKCQDLSTFLQALHANASITAMNPEFTEFRVPENMVRLWSSGERELDPNTRDFLRQAAELAKREIAET